MRDVREYGETRRYLKRASAAWTAEEADGLEGTAIAAYLMRAARASRSPDDQGFAFLAITDIHWVQ